MEKVFYTHKFRDSKNRRLTIAGVIQDNKMLFGYAICSNKDQFAKFRGRIIAEGRAKKLPIHEENIENNLHTGKLFINLAEKIAKEV